MNRFLQFNLHSNYKWRINTQIYTLHDDVYDVCTAARDRAQEPYKVFVLYSSVAIRGRFFLRSQGHEVI